jgi:hypothetical protein
MLSVSIGVAVSPEDARDGSGLLTAGSPLLEDVAPKRRETAGR